MQSLEKAAMAIYLIFVNDRKTCFALTPSRLFDLVMNNKPLTPQYRKVEQVIDSFIYLPFEIVGPEPSCTDEIDYDEEQ